MVSERKMFAYVRLYSLMSAYRAGNSSALRWQTRVELPHVVESPFIGHDKGK
jgi:hypothetical protein